MPAPEKTLLFLNAVADWADQRNVEIRIWRTDVPAGCNYGTPIADWRVTVTLRDSEGFVHGTVNGFHPFRREADADLERRVARALDRCCAEARRRRIEAYTRADPRRVMQGVP
jgi:hypothetical protein